MTRDVRVIDGGSIVLLMPLTVSAEAWCREYLPEDCPTFGASYAIERRFVSDILTGLDMEGLTYGS